MRGAEEKGGRAGRLDGWVVAAATLVLRGWLVVALADVFGYGEELEKGAAAKALLDRLRPTSIVALLVTLVLQHRQPHQRLNACHIGTGGIQRVFVIERDLPVGALCRRHESPACIMWVVFS